MPSTSLFAINEAFESLKKQTAIMLCTRSLKNWAFRQKCINHALQHKPSKLESKNKEQREHALAFIHRNGNKTLARNARGRNKSIRARSRASFLQSATRWTTATALSQRFSLSLFFQTQLASPLRAITGGLLAAGSSFHLYMQLQCPVSRLDITISFAHARGEGLKLPPRDFLIITIANLSSRELVRARAHVIYARYLCRRDYS